MSDYVNSVMNYTGNKFRLLPQIIPRLDYSKKIYIGKKMMIYYYTTT
jgi:hypothetical protein